MKGLLVDSKFVVFFVLRTGKNKVFEASFSDIEKY